MQITASISQLPLQLLAEVLQHVDLKERLSSCALVCSMWHAAAVAATRSISISTWCSREQAKYNGLHAWLLKHGQAAAIHSLDVHGRASSNAQLLLPLQQLTALGKLVLKCMRANFQKGTADQQVSTAALPYELSALTHLELCDCPMELSALPAFTQLQHLCLTYPC